MTSPAKPATRGTARDDSSISTRAGYVTLVGRPNAGKSTLLNALVDEKLSIVTSKAQTTWRRVTGIATEGGVQTIFLDTPGLLEVRDVLQRSMLSAALEAVREADVLLVVLDATELRTDEDEETLESALERASAPVVAAVNKIDAAEDDSVRSWQTWAEETLDARAHPVSALERTGLEDLRRDLRELLPVSPYLYPEDHLASDPVRFFVAELVRETVFEQFRQEIPYSVYCTVEEYRAGQEPVYIGITLYVERESQKGILVGKGGKAIRALGRESREKIEAFVGEPVYLDLWVKVLPKWRRKKSHLRRLGFSVPEDDDEAT